MSNTQNTVTGLLIGLLVGGAAGVLLAPKSGKETRQDISKRLTDLLNKANDMKKELQNSLVDATEEEKEKIQGYLNQLDDYLNNVLSNAKASK